MYQNALDSIYVRDFQGEKWSVKIVLLGKQVSDLLLVLRTQHQPATTSVYSTRSCS